MAIIVRGKHSSPASSETVMLLTGAHSVHEKFGESIRADNSFLSNYVLKKQGPHEKFLNLMRSVRALPSGYRYMLTESCFYYPALRRKLGGFGSKIINLNCSPLLYKMANHHLKFPESNLMSLLLPEVDGHLVFGDYGKEILGKADPGKPYEVVYPFIKRDSYEMLKGIQSGASKASITIFIAYDPYYKGLDLLMMALSETKLDLKLNIVGKADISDIVKRFPVGSNIEINALGYVPDPGSVFKDTGLFVTMGRGDTFPIATLEAMLAGVPALVSDQTGTKEVCSKIDPNLVCRLDASELRGRLEWFFGLGERDRSALSKSAKTAASGFDEQSSLALFKARFDSLRDRL